MKTVLIICTIFIIAAFTIQSCSIDSTKSEEAKLLSQAISELAQIKGQLQQIRQYIENSNYQYVSLTAYHPPSRGINSDSTPNKTATMRKPVPGYTLAISDELFHMGWLGRKIYIEGWGVGKATDRMASTVTGKRIDVCISTLKLAKRFGIKKNVMAVALQ